MHRQTGMVNPDVPLGHHIGQDVGHISSTVLRGSLALDRTHYQLSTFNGREPLPTEIDLPIRKPDSGAFRLVQEFSPKLMTMASVAYLQDPENAKHKTDKDNPNHLWRLSTSVYSIHSIHNDWTLYNTLIYGYISDYEHSSSLSSVAQKFLFQGECARFWSRIHHDG